MFMPASSTRPYNYIGKPRCDTETIKLSEEEQDDYITRVLKENGHKKDLNDFSNPTKKLKTVMDIVKAARGKSRVVREQLRMHKLDFVIRTKLPPKSNPNTRYREENILRDARRTLNWLYEIADEENVDVSDISEPTPHFYHTVELFVSGEYVFDLRDVKLVRAAYEDCFEGCTVMLRKKRAEEINSYEASIERSERVLGEEPDFETMGRFISDTDPRKVANKLPPPPYVSSTLATPSDVLNESMMVDGDVSYETPTKKAGKSDDPVSPPFPNPTPRKFMSRESIDRSSKSREFFDRSSKARETRALQPASPPKRSKRPSAPMPPPRRKSLFPYEVPPTRNPPDTATVKRETVIYLSGKLFKMTTETKFEQIEEETFSDV